jgi:hypothetical protein
MSELQTIWNSDKFAADTRPEWVKAILRGGYKVTAFLDDDSGRWYFEPTKSDLPVGYALWLYKKTGGKIPSIWDGEKWLDMRAPEGKKLRDKTYAAGLSNLKEYGG